MILMTQGGNSNKMLQGARPKTSQRHRLCTHHFAYNLGYVSNIVEYVLNNLNHFLNIWIQEFQKRSKRVAIERSREEIRGRAHKPK